MKLAVYRLVSALTIQRWKD